MQKGSKRYKDLCGLLTSLPNFDGLYSVSVSGDPAQLPQYSYVSALQIPPAAVRSSGEGLQTTPLIQSRAIRKMHDKIERKGKPTD